MEFALFTLLPLWCRLAPLFLSLKCKGRLRLQPGGRGDGCECEGTPLHAGAQWAKLRKASAHRYTSEVWQVLSPGSRRRGAPFGRRGAGCLQAFGTSRRPCPSPCACGPPRACGGTGLGDELPPRWRLGAAETREKHACVCWKSFGSGGKAGSLLSRPSAGAASPRRRLLLPVPSSLPASPSFFASAPRSVSRPLGPGDDVREKRRPGRRAADGGCVPPARALRGVRVAPPRPRSPGLSPGRPRAEERAPGAEGSHLLPAGRGAGNVRRRRAPAARRPPPPLAARLLLRGRGCGALAAGGLAQPGRWGPPPGTRGGAGTLGGLETSRSAHPLYCIRLRIFGIAPSLPFFGLSSQGCEFGGDALFSGALMVGVKSSLRSILQGFYSGRQRVRNK